MAIGPSSNWTKWQLAQLAMDQPVMDQLAIGPNGNWTTSTSTQYSIMLHMQYLIEINGVALDEKTHNNNNKVVM
jgi:hypothetical protein